MTAKIIPLIYVLALGFVAYRLCNATFPEDHRFGPRHIAFFIILNVTGFLLTGFLPAPYAVFFVVVMLSILALAPVEPVARIAMFAFLCPLMPTLDFDLQIGVPIIWMTWSRLLTIIILLPLLVGAFSRKPPFHYSLDKFVWAFFLLNAILAFRDTSFTNGLRGITYLSIDILAPYFVLTRYLNSFADIRKVLFALLGALVFAGLVNVFESVRTWHVYEQLIYNINGARFTSLFRLGLLRATGPFDIPSRSAFALATGLGLCWALAPYISKRKLLFGIVAILAAGIFFTFSRGNWFGAVIIGGCFLFTANRKQFFKLGAALAVAFMLVSTTQFADDVYNLLPFVGSDEGEAAGTVGYREELLNTSIQVANENPWFGSNTFHEHPDMNALRQSSGLLDLVNHYVIVLLNTGYTGLTLFVAIFLSTLLTLRRALRDSAGKPADQRNMCRAILFTLVGLLVAITTTSALGRVGLILWCLVAIAAVAADILAPRAYLRK